MDIKSLHDIYQLRAPQSANRAAKRVVEDASGGVASDSFSGVDIIKISPEAAFRNKLDAMIKTFAQQAESEPSAARLEALRSDYDGEHCPISSQQIVDVLLTHVQRPVLEQRSVET